MSQQRMEPVNKKWKIKDRCKEDSLNIPQTHERLSWVEKYKVIPKSKINEMLYTFDDDLKVVKRDRPGYPMFGTYDGVSIENSTLWIPESEKLPAILPNHIHWLTTCTASCYTSDQELLTEQGYIPIRKATEEKIENLMIVAKGSTINDIRLEKEKVGSYVASFRNNKHKIISFSTESGGNLKVTPGHVILNGIGILKTAASFKVGDSFLNEVGEKDEIVSIQAEEYFGKVYNVRPKSRDPEKNLVVAQGFINGSDRFQNDWANQVNKEILVKNIPNNLF